MGHPQHIAAKEFSLFDCHTPLCKWSDMNANFVVDKIPSVRMKAKADIPLLQHRNDVNSQPHKAFLSFSSIYSSILLVHILLLDALSLYTHDTP